MLGRRHFVAGALGILSGPATGGIVLRRPQLRRYPFALGVASGDPRPDGMVLWTRLAPLPTLPDWGMPPVPVGVRWEIATDEHFTAVVKQGETIALPEMGHSVHVEPVGLLPGRPYWYRFIADGAVSQVGRTRTAPSPSADVDRLRYAFCACQRFENGYYGAYRHMVADDPELIVFLGDYIYEQVARDGLPRRHPEQEANDLTSYRLRYATYKSDPDLQAAHAAAPWMVIWDDHEVKNNYGGDRLPGSSEGAIGLRRRAAAYKAFYEHMPISRRSVPIGADMLIYRTLDWGRLAQFQFVDGRQYRGIAPCPDQAGAKGAVPDCVERRDPTRSLLGATQEHWLMKALENSEARWNILAQQYVMAELRRNTPDSGKPIFSIDGWDGYPASRERLLRQWIQADVANPYAIGGDMHAFAASDLRLSPDQPVIAPAFVGGAISSPGGEDDKMAKLQKLNPDFRFADSTRNGYTFVEADREKSVINYRALDDVTERKTGVKTLARFVIEDGVRGGVRPA